MDLDQVRDHLAGLDGVREQRRDGRVGWYVAGRLVARVEDDETLVVRSDFAERERLVDAHPDTFSVPPLEAHMKVLADLRRGGDAAIRAALTAAWELQR